MQNPTEKMPIGITKLRRRYRRFMIIYAVVMLLSMGISVANFTHRISEQKSYLNGYSAGLDTSLAISKRIFKRDRWFLKELSDSLTTRSVEHFVDHSEIK